MGREDGRPDVVGLGEAMVLLEPPEGAGLATCETLVPRVAGAELNLLAAVARLGLATAFHSRVGDDPFGERIRQAVRTLGVEDRIEVDRSAPTGVFFKDPSAGDERRVHYYRRGSAASQMDHADGVRATQVTPKAFVASGITVALGPGPAAAVQAVCASMRGGDGWFVVDPNLRAPLGGYRAIARHLPGLLASCDLLLAGRSEAETMFGSDDPDVIRQRAHDAGVREVVLKDGARGCWYEHRSRMEHLPAVPVDAVDTVGAGDAFGGAYLGARLRGASPAGAALLGTQLAAATVAVRGDVEGLPSSAAARDMLSAVVADRPHHP